MKIMIVDGQGGGIGRAIIERLKGRISSDCKILAIGTNSMATSAMMKAGCDIAATGENAVIYNASQVDIIVGSIGIISANSMLGEMSAAMANAISSSSAVKILVPLNRCNLQVAGVADMPLPKILDETADMIIKCKGDYRKWEM